MQHKSLRLAVKFRSTAANYMATEGNLFIRHASAKDMDFVTREAIQEGRLIGPYDCPSAFAFNPQGIHVGKLWVVLVLSHTQIITLIIWEDCW